MRKVINLNKDWLFLKGDLKVPRPKDKGPVYAQSKIERKIMGPAAYEYFEYTAGADVPVPCGIPERL